MAFFISIFNVERSIANAYCLIILKNISTEYPHDTFNRLKFDF